ncbi:MAG: hypothetical protein IH984_07430 [Planctomycetes bacterium]|nr:hypothetical protein [Planctomycetota bacterium]
MTEFNRQKAIAAIDELLNTNKDIEDVQRDIEAEQDREHNDWLQQHKENPGQIDEFSSRSPGERRVLEALERILPDEEQLAELNERAHNDFADRLG